MSGLINTDIYAKRRRANRQGKKDGEEQGHG